MKQHVTGQPGLSPALVTRAPMAADGLFSPEVRSWSQVSVLLGLHLSLGQMAQGEHSPGARESQSFITLFLPNLQSLPQ